MDGSVAVLDDLPGSDVFPVYIEVFQGYLSPNKIPSSSAPLNKPSSLMSMACFRAIGRGIDHHKETDNSCRGIHHDFLDLWPGIRAWCSHFMSVCTANASSASNFDFTVMKMSTSICLQSLRLYSPSIIATEYILRLLLIEFWRESCRSSCNISVRNMSYILDSVLADKETREVIWPT